MICYGSDGDGRFLKSQKSLVKFGSFKSQGSMILGGDFESEYQASQDSLHIAKKLKNSFYYTSEALRMGNRCALIGHLVILIKRFDKNQHNLNLSDLDPTDKMNYQ